MASLFGAVATEFGGTVKDLAVQKRDDRLADEERQHQMQLDKQRRQFEASELTRRIEADDRRQARRLEYETQARDAEFEWRSGEREAGEEADWRIAQLGSQTDLLQTAMQQYFSQNRTTRRSGGGWQVSTEREQVIDPTSPSGFRMEEFWTAIGPSGHPYRIVGDMAFDPGMSEPRTQFETVDLRRQAEAPLFDGEITPETFKDIHGYIPSSYIFGRVGQADDNFRSFLESNNIRIPALDLPGLSGSVRGGGGGGDARAREIFEEGVEPGSGAPMRPSIEELSDGPARDAHIEEHGTWEEQADALREEAEGGGDRGLLTQGQAEVEGDLEGGGQLEQPGPPEAPPDEGAPPTMPVRPEVERSWGGAVVPEDRERLADYRAELAELSDDDITDMIDNIQMGMTGTTQQLQDLRGEQRRRERESTIYPHDLLFNTEKAQAWRAENARLSEEFLERQRQEQAAAGE